MTLCGIRCSHLCRTLRLKRLVIYGVHLPVKRLVGWLEAASNGRMYTGETHG